MKELCDMMKQLLGTQTPNTTTESTPVVALVVSKPLTGYTEATNKTVGDEAVEGEDESKR
jgi:hypothetical protein